jgi:hypothetical protein
MEDIREAVKKAAEIVSRDWVTTLDQDDVEQDIWLELLEDDGLMKEVENSSSPLTILRHLGNRNASRIVNAYEFYSGQYQYGTKEVRGILEQGVLTTHEFRTTTEKQDILGGMECLRERNDRYADVIVNRFYWKDRTVDTKTVTRAVDALTQEMNRVNTLRRFSHKEGPGKRTVVSNAASIDATRASRNQENRVKAGV